jgi:hypothetical protein
MGRKPPPTTTQELLRNFQANYEADFWYATLSKIKMENKPINQN